MHIAEKYANDVLNGNILACRWVKLACERFFRDLDNPKFKFVPEKANHALNFFKLLRHSKGEWAGQTFVLEPWQAFIISNLFGWVEVDTGFRRFKVGYICVGRKNGKTTVLSGIGLYLFVADGEMGSEVYTAATKRDQAVLLHSESTRMVKASSSLRKQIGIFKNNLHHTPTNSKFEPLGADSQTYDGLNVHGALIDELHAHKTRGMWDVLETATSSRRQPMQIAITTAGFDQSGICMEQQLYVQQILKGSIVDDSYFGIIYTIDRKADWPDMEEDDDWKDSANWIKANPNLGVSVYLDDIQRKCKKAEKIPASINNFITKHMDVWTQQVVRWIDLDLWDANLITKINEDDLQGRLCYGGVDLSSVSDLTCWVMLFPDYPERKDISIIMRCWCPEMKLYDDQNKYKDQYQAWNHDGHLRATEGDAIDYDFVRKQIVKDAGKFNIKSIAVDRLFQGYDFSIRLNQDLGGSEKMPKVIPCGMGYRSMAAPCQEMERLLLEKLLNHGGNPVLRFMADSVAVSIDPAGNRKPNKDKSQGKIDGIIGILLGLDRLMREFKRDNPYEGRGPIFI